MTLALQRKLKRLVDGGSHGALIVELEHDGLRIRPKYARRGGAAERHISWGQIYQRLMIRGTV